MRLLETAFAWLLVAAALFLCVAVLATVIIALNGGEGADSTSRTACLFGQDHYDSSGMPAWEHCTLRWPWHFYKHVGD